MSGASTSAPGRSGSLRAFRPRPLARRRLVCFPHAGGGGGFFRSWLDLVPADVELVAVQYPGREDRTREAFVSDMAELADAVAEDLARDLTRPLVLFGHSMGASVAYEVARRLAARRPEAVELLAVSGQVGPREQRRTPVEHMTHRLDDERFGQALAELGGTPAEVLADPELRALLFPVVRNDYRLIESYEPAPAPPLSVDVLALIGDRDEGADLTAVSAWADATTGRFRLRVFPGDHFFLVPHRREVVAAIVGWITGSRGGDGRP
ncbi:thioesterase II family protein [Streptoalloteichus hindustanus]|uniref:Pyochelin biosynthetic protein PchC n=1 Tax=Streptoalloteichus hindustanus TaxID=2017 RepID=A0A1M5AA54_STRHI|nr:alpha/beta fold hydrolase [Streptoalloteichus hindustanus]SHF27149.1 pyochelin biosynthetic protein PchC [Streptoalloteichus hindustanus]